MTTILTIVAAILIFALLIFIHELGHFLVAKWTGIKVLEFAIGMGPTVSSFVKGETKYSVRAFPIGGFCAMEGEDTESKDERAFGNKPAWARFLVLVAGATMNILLGFVLLIVLYSFTSTIAIPQVDTVAENGSAYQSGLQVGDKIVKINGARIHIANDLYWEKTKLAEKTANFIIERNGEQKTIAITPTNAGGQYSYGLSLKTVENNFGLSLQSAYYETFFYSKVVVESLVGLLRGQYSVKDMSGPVGIVSEIGSAVKESVEVGLAGLFRLMYLAILLTINLGVFNLLPIPALDGGRILFVLVELIRRKPLPPEKEGMVHMIGFAALILLTIFVTYMDVSKIVVKFFG